ncbi:MAG: GNAT family N-acetyltransferase [Burkholderiales bacterium]|nr:GNAT family N-acetyltransferase [Burkholderiales bacterium]
MTRLLDNIAWHALTGPQAGCASGAGAARRFAPGFSPIVGFADAERPDLAALTPFCTAGEQFYCLGWSGEAAGGWRIDVDAAICQMVWDAALPDAADAALAIEPLGPAHGPAMLELAALTRPGPFGPRTPELGDYFGCFDGERLVAMAGERMRAATLHEISGVCTHPDFQGRGLARALMIHLIRRQLQRGATPFLHVMQANAGARRLYARMGFREHRATAVRVISPPP